jgi:hypothetical protein
MAFSNHENGAPRQEISKWLTVCSTFSRSGWSVVRSVSLAEGSTLKKRPSSHLHKVPTRSNKVSPRTLRTALVYKICCYFNGLWPATCADSELTSEIMNPFRHWAIGSLHMRPRQHGHRYRLLYIISDLLLCVILNSTDFDYFKFVRYNPKYFDI